MNVLNQPQAEMPRYVCHKTVHALKVASQWTQEAVYLAPFDSRYSMITVTRDWANSKRVPLQGEGYYVVYEDGYTSWSPTEAFEKGYTPLDPLIPNIDSDPLVTLSPRMVLTSIQRALNGILTRYTTLVNSGDAGNWNPEGEDVVKQARAALALIDSTLVSSPSIMRSDLPIPDKLVPGGIVEVDNLAPLRQALAEWETLPISGPFDDLWLKRAQAWKKLMDAARKLV